MALELSRSEIETIYKQGKFNLDSLDLIIQCSSFLLKGRLLDQQLLKRNYRRHSIMPSESQSRRPGVPEPPSQQIIFNFLVAIMVRAGLANNQAIIGLK